MDLPTSHLFRHDEFASRHIGPSPDELDSMLAAIGVESVDELIRETVPESILIDEELDLDAPRSEPQVLGELADLAAQNRQMINLIGQGYFGTTTPPVIARNVLENPAWYTSYTPYQAEISQGRLEATLNFQTAVANICGLAIANASLLDEATAAAEAMTLALRATKHSSRRFFVDVDTLPQTIAVLRTRAEPIGIELVIADVDNIDDYLGDVFGVLLSYPTATGRVRDIRSTVQKVHEHGALCVTATDLAACVLLEPPGVLGADVAIGSAQRFGVPLGFGGPHAGFITVRESLARHLPGRLVGVSVDDSGEPALRLALQTREQHIRRDKATSNICTAQALLANIAGFYAAWHGPDGLRAISIRIHSIACVFADHLDGLGFHIRHDRFFDTIVVDDVDADAVLAAAVAVGINLRRVADRSVGISFDETTTPALLTLLSSVFGGDTDFDSLSSSTDAAIASAIPDELWRTHELLPHDVFRRYHTETEMMRYLRRLADRDLALDRTMIPLGSCTMKLNATAEMMPITWPGFANIHPYAPLDQTVGYRSMITSLEDALAVITGYDSVSVQPNAGSQGELAGLLAIRAYHRSTGDERRDVCLIPSSAHGTNAASAVMAGMRVVVVGCDDDGNVDVDDLDAKIQQVDDTLSCIMVTYPSTHGVFEAGIVDICDRVHRAGGQVYVDGANMNALVGLARPGSFGADVSHLNLHKTFCIPHGGGGPGVGPVAVRAHLAPFLPGDPNAPADGTVVGAVAAAPFGSAGILPISWAYLRLMGARGLRRATEIAICSANYIAARLSHAYPVLYTGSHGRVAHECIVDLREITRTTGVTIDDVAKRLIDYGFHAPTVSFPVAGTLMVEPTESESLAELDRFIDAMLSIRSEIDEIAAGSTAVGDSPLRHAPHTAQVLAGEWERAYPRRQAAFPGGTTRQDKYFSPVGRVDNAYGDRNLACDCAPIEAYATANTEQPDHVAAS